VRVLTVNVARPQPNPWKGLVATGIEKRPTDGPVLVSVPGANGDGTVGLAGDRVFDVKHHGGPDQAVYAYARADLDFWEPVLLRPLPNGAFGENLTTAGLDVSGASVGERWRIGAEVVLEVSCPRIPCATFQGWLQQAGWIKQFTQAAMPGAYLRVVTPGSICGGDRVEIIDQPDHGVTISLAFRALTAEPDLLPRLLAAEALPESCKERARARLPSS
jgi:MOSC domain-containing protein YiiM